MHTVERHAYRWWLEAAAAASPVSMIPQGDSVHDIAGVAGQTYRFGSRVACIPLVVGSSSFCCQSSGYDDSPGEFSPGATDLASMNDSPVGFISGHCGSCK